MKKFRTALAITLVLLLMIGIRFVPFLRQTKVVKEGKAIAIVTPTPTPTPPIIENYEVPAIPDKPAYTILFVGDSMTEALGVNFDQLRVYLKAHYPDKIFGLFNYGYGSSSLLTVMDRLEKETVYQGRVNPAILGRQSDVVIIESFGHNPLSDLPLEEGLKKQEEILDEVVARLVFEKPETLIVFLATIAPSRTKYASHTDLSPEVRRQWAEERRAYIENHVAYANSHNIPLIDVYHKSLGEDGEVLLKYVNHDDYIHPSAEGVQLISAMIADYFYVQNVLVH